MGKIINLYLIEIKINHSNSKHYSSSEQSNDADIDFAIIQIKELTENVKNLQPTYQNIINISDTLPSKDTENKCAVLLKLNSNTVPAWK